MTRGAIGNNGAVAGSGGKHGSHSGPRPRAPHRTRRLLALTAGVTGLVVAWGYLVWAAIDFGTTAREGRATAWWFLALASLGAVACLFAGLMVGLRLLRELGVVSPEPAPGAEPPAPRPRGGKRAAR